MKVEGVPLEVLRTRTSEKWSGFDADVLPMPVAEMDFELATPIREVLLNLVNNSDTGYMGKTDHLTKNFTKFAQDRWGWTIDQKQLFLCTDVGVGSIEMARTIVQPGDVIMVNSPVYLNMYNWIKELHCQVIDAPMRKEGMEYSLDLAAIEAGYKEGLKIHFLCNPQNPTGSVHTFADLEALASLAKHYGVYVFSDEIHAPLVFDESEFVPFLSVSEEAREIGICVTAASKTWNLAGLKCAFIVTASDRTLALTKKLSNSVRFRASLFGAHATAKAFECTDWLDGVMDLLDSNRQLVKSELEAKLPLAKYRVPNCSYLAWIDLSAYELGASPSEIALEKGRVAFTPGHLFGQGCEQYIRLNFATSPKLIVEGITRLATAIEKAKSAS